LVGILTRGDIIRAMAADLVWFNFLGVQD
jgi:CBS domain-containing protein